VRQTPTRSAFRGTVVSLRLHRATRGVDGRGLCWLEGHGFNLPERNANMSACDFRYGALPEAMARCEREGWCGGVMKDNGVRCGSGLRRFQLRAARRPPQVALRDDYVPMLLVRQPLRHALSANTSAAQRGLDEVRAWCMRRVLNHRARAIDPATMDGTPPGVLAVDTSCPKGKSARRGWWPAFNAM
jgi:hypothetical protein